jgi:hypothetical protein
MSEVANNEVVLARLEKIERENRILKRCVAFVLLALGALLVMAQAPSRPRTVETDMLVIKYPNGKEAVHIGILNGQAVIRLFNLKGEIGISAYAGEIANLHVAGDTAEIALSAGTSVANDLRTPVADYAALTVSKTKPSFQPMLNLIGNGSQSTLFLYGKGRTQARLRNGPGGPSLQLFDDPDTVRAALGGTAIETTLTGTVETRPLSSLVLFDKEGKVLWRAP